MSTRTLTDGSPVTPDHREIDPATGMQKAYVVLSADERAKGFVRPVRRTYVHQKCGVVGFPDFIPHLCMCRELSAIRDLLFDECQKGVRMCRSCMAHGVDLPILYSERCSQDRRSSCRSLMRIHSSFSLARSAALFAATIARM